MEQVEPRLAVAGAVSLVADGLLLGYPNLPVWSGGDESAGLFGAISGNPAIGRAGGLFDRDLADAGMFGRGEAGFAENAAAMGIGGVAYLVAGFSGLGAGGTVVSGAVPGAKGADSMGMAAGSEAGREVESFVVGEDGEEQGGPQFLTLVGSETQLLEPVDVTVQFEEVGMSEAPETAPSEAAGPQVAARISGAGDGGGSSSPGALNAPQPAEASTPELTASYGPLGIHSLSYGGVEMINTTESWQPGNMRLYQWWEQKPGETKPTPYFADAYTRPTGIYDAATQTSSKAYSWGTISTRYTTQGDRILMRITVTNTTQSTTVTGWNAFLTLLDFPTVPAINGVLIANSNQQPVVVRADFTTGAATVTNEAIDKTKTVYGGYRTLTGDGTDMDKRYVFVGSTNFQFHTDKPSDTSRPLAPGASDTFDMALRFGPGGSSTGGGDVGNFDDAFPQQLYWPDRRPIGAMFTASTGTEFWPTNPNGMLRDPNLNVYTTNGKIELRARLEEMTRNSINRALEKNSQGIVIWNIEGNQYSHEPWWIGYAGAPQHVDEIAPELAFAPNGEKTVDMMFRMMREAGLRSGMTIRPEKLVRGLGGWVQEVQPTEEGKYQVMLEKIRYAQARWGCSIFYIDVLEAIEVNVVQRLQAALPDVLLIPEHELQRTYAYAGAWLSTETAEQWQTPTAVDAFYPGAFSAVGAFKSEPTQQSYLLLKAAVARGDLLLAHSWWDAPMTQQVNNIYAEADVGGVKAKTTVAQGRTFSVYPFVSTVAPKEVDRIEVNWGDGSPVETFTGLQAKLDHVFAGGLGTYQVSTTMYTKDGSEFQLNQLTATVNLAGAVIDPISNIQATSGQLVNFPSFTFTDPDKTGLYAVKVSWGDGTSDTLDYIDQGNGVYATLPAYKTFRGNAVRTVTVEVTDSSGAIGRRTFTVDVRMPFRGTGTGLQGTYRNNGSSSVVTRTDAGVNFNFSNQPITGVDADRFSVTWTGKIQAQFNETYTFSTQADDGLVLWVNGVKLIDRWLYHGVEQSATINLVAGQQYDIRIDYHDMAAVGFVKVFWESASTPKELLPTTQLFPSTDAPSMPPLVPVDLPPVYLAGADLPPGPDGNDPGTRSTKENPLPPVTGA